MILNDKQIKERSINNKLIKPFLEKQLTPNGYDVTIEEVEPFSSTYIVPPKSTFIVLTKETLNMPPNLVGQMKIKTKWARKGLILSDGLIEAGFRGQLNLCFYNASENEVKIGKLPIVQVYFSEIETVEKQYEERSGNYQDLHTIMRV